MHGSLHHNPPLTPGNVLFYHPALIWVVAGVSVVLGGLAAVDGGSVLLTWDQPIQEWVENNRTSGYEDIFRGFSRLGSNLVVFSVFAVLVVLAARKCRVFAVSLAVAVLARPPFEYVIKELVDRDRPDLTRLVDGTGPSHPSGHVLAAVALWGLLPPLVSLLTDRRWVWWIATATSAVLIAGIAASRMYLGVHWFSDIVQGFVLGWLYLTAIEILFVRHHHNRACSRTLSLVHHLPEHRHDWPIPREWIVPVDGLQSRPPEPRSGEDAMTRIPTHTLDDAPKGSRDGLEAVGERYGMTPNIYAQMAHAPAVINGLGALGQAIEEHTTLDREARETIALAVAAANHCDYCQAAHTMAGKAAGLTEDQTIQIRRGQVDDDKLDTLANVAREATENTGTVSDATWQAALDAGWSDTELADAFAAITLNIATSYFTHYAGTELDLPPAPSIG